MADLTLQELEDWKAALHRQVLPRPLPPEPIAAMVEELIRRRAQDEVDWQVIHTAPLTGDVLCLDIRTGQRAISSYNDHDWRRGFRHRNGFPATHWTPLKEPLPLEPEWGVPAEYRSS